jgi:hypothetical protein
MLGVDTEPIHKSGYWWASKPRSVASGLVVGGQPHSRRDRSRTRTDSLIKLLAAENFFGWW